MICPDCGKEFDAFLDESEFNMFCEDPTFNYAELPYPMCYQCARIYFDSMFPNAEDESEYDDIYNS